ncbi:hypothetical protein AGR4C_Lc10049 [Agrobacterium tumefaciens str. Kerr 14]|uniref:Uncharacterized protein n=1 Tax=Agrobacterium tumefaciens str. Kerr 14 TaxID=1183424 RepID=A0A1S7QYR9_AGRTU|nr:hypothetical protein AGR4C_Lc10049 [Agrobacterium tumefaciens str. Kerr 14]
MHNVWMYMCEAAVSGSNAGDVV